MVAHNTSTDRIEKNAFLRAPRARVWRAITDPREFGEWFRVKLEGPFAEGATVHGHILEPGYQHLEFTMQIERVEAERYFSYRWHPYAIDPARDYSVEPTTLVEFFLDDAPGGVRVRIVESGFDGVPLERRAEAFRMNDQGWAIQATNLEKHVAS